MNDTAPATVALNEQGQFIPVNQDGTPWIAPEATKKLNKKKPSAKSALKEAEQLEKVYTLVNRTPPRPSKARKSLGKPWQVLEFQGKVFTNIVHGFGNYEQWKEILKAPMGTKIKNLELTTRGNLRKKEGWTLIDADSNPVILD